MCDLCGSLPSRCDLLGHTGTRDYHTNQSVLKFNTTCKKQKTVHWKHNSKTKSKKKQVFCEPLLLKPFLFDKKHYFCSLAGVVATVTATNAMFKS